MNTTEALKAASVRIESMIETGRASAGHVTITPRAVRLTLFQAMEDGAMMHVQYDLLWEELEQFTGGPEQLLSLSLTALLNKLCGEDA